MTSVSFFYINRYNRYVYTPQGVHLFTSVVGSCHHGNTKIFGYSHLHKENNIP